MLQIDWDDIMMKQTVSFTITNDMYNDLMSSSTDETLNKLLWYKDILYPFIESEVDVKEAIKYLNTRLPWIDKEIITSLFE